MSAHTDTTDATAPARRTVADLVAEGPPEDGSRVRVTQQPIVTTMAELSGLLPFGLVENGLQREYTWKRLTGAARLEAGRVRQAMAGQSGLLPAIVSVSLESLGGRPATPDRVRQLTYSDVLYLLFDRATEIAGQVPIMLPWKCPSCGGPPPKLTRDNVHVGRMEVDLDHPPRAVAWLEEPLRYGERVVEALVLGPASWGALYHGATMADLRNVEWAKVRSVSAGVTGYVADGQVIDGTIPRSLIETGLLAREFDVISPAVWGCSGGFLSGATIEHACGSWVYVPFELSTEM